MMALGLGAALTARGAFAPPTTFLRGVLFEGALRFLPRAVPSSSELSSSSSLSSSLSSITLLARLPRPEEATTLRFLEGVEGFFGAERGGGGFEAREERRRGLEAEVVDETDDARAPVGRVRCEVSRVSLLAGWPTWRRRMQSRGRREETRRREHC